MSGTAFLEQFGNDELASTVERVFIAKEIGDADQKVAKQRADLLQVAAEAIRHRPRRGELIDLHPAADPTQERLRFVAAEIVADPLAKQRVNFHAQRERRALIIKFRFACQTVDCA